ncbi:MAG: DNA repair protein RadC [Ignavibacterium album]|uniref:JAB domain-containing protein n=1 Tax=Ignavibacterium album TaxID=591197 RepID=UPI0026F003C3|nr:DNA repair protein RadC [Ignavibacterium album]MCX8106737.1 DNA repair protein RadC [Ignavibacterium album]
MGNNNYYNNHRGRLRKRFLEFGISSLLPHEVIELFLTFVIPQRDVKKEAHQIIEKFGSVKNFFEASDEELSEIKFFKEKALTLRKFIIEFSNLYHKQIAESASLSYSKKELIDYCIRKLGNLKEEEFWLFTINSKNQIINEHLISKGVSDKTPVYPKRILELALNDKANSILVTHNHPNGNPNPSDYDITVTKALDIPAQVLGLKIIDHIIVSYDSYFSMRDKNLI